MDISFVLEIKRIISQARKHAYSAVNSAMVEAYWQIGKHIIEEEQRGKHRAEYGDEIIKKLSQELSADFGKGFSVTNLKNFRKFYKTFNELEIGQTLSDLSGGANGQALSAQLSWSHFERLIRVENKEARNWYLKETKIQNWSVRTLDRNISTLYFHRLLSSQQERDPNIEKNDQAVQAQVETIDFIKNPAVLEFLNLPSGKSYTEREFEQALIDNLQNFLLELGRGFSFVTRQKHIRTETSDFYIDLVFYNFILKCFVLVELKTDKLTHQDVGQLDMYVRMFDDLEKQKDDNPTIGILLSTETDKTIVKYSVLNDSKQLFATKYLSFLPTEQELIAEIDREKLFFKNRLRND